MTPLGWLGIARLGLVQTAIGAIVILTTSTLNRVVVVELALPAMLPGALVGWHHAVQLSRPRWGYGADLGGSRTPWKLRGGYRRPRSTTAPCWPPWNPVTLDGARPAWPCCGSEKGTSAAAPQGPASAFDPTTPTENTASSSVSGLKVSTTASSA